MVNADKTGTNFVVKMRFFWYCIVVAFLLIAAITYWRPSNRQEIVATFTGTDQESASSVPFPAVFLPRASPRGQDLIGFYGMDMPPLPEHSDDSSLYPDPAHPWDDRVIQQLSYVPRVRPTSFKTILLPHTHDRNIRMGRTTLLDLKCKVSECDLTADIGKTLTADLVLLSDRRDIANEMLKILQNNTRRLDQIWLFYMFESPARYSHDVFRNKEFNWTLSYTSTSTISGIYAKFYPITAGVTTVPQTRNYAAGKTGKVVWFVSNCRTVNRRMQYVKKLSEFIQVDIFGRCGNKPRECSGYSGEVDECMSKTISKYKFYLSFENSNCETYISEKYFISGLSHEVIPVVMGAQPGYYKQKSPPHSHIHVEEFSGAEQLAQYLHKLDKNDTLYNGYFQWKGAWRYLPTLNWLCRMCAMLHAPRRTIRQTYQQWSKSDPCRASVRA